MNPEHSTDEALMARVAQGDAAAFNHLVRQHLPRAYAIARRVLNSNSEAEDAAQEAFTKIWVNARDFDPSRAKFTTWMHRIVVNASLDMARKKKPLPVADEMLHSIPDTADNAETMAAGAEQDALVRDAIAALPPQQRAAITLCYAEGYSNADAARLMGVHLKALEGLLVRAKKTLRQRLIELKKGERHAA